MTAMAPMTTSPGFDNPIHEAQQVFRAVLESLSRPGLPMTVSPLPPPLPCGSMSQGLLSLALTLCDATTKVWLDDVLNNQNVRHHLRFHCATPLTSKSQEAAFAFIAHSMAMPPLHSFSWGQAEYPERSTTLFVAVNTVEEAQPLLEVTGPGVKGNDTGEWLTLPSFALPNGFLDDWNANSVRYPLGVDVVLVETITTACGGSEARFWGLPRTARIRRKGQPVQIRTTKESGVCM